MVVAVAVVAALVVASQVFTSALRYRRTMRKEWPRVEPRDDWDDD